MTCLMPSISVRPAVAGDWPGYRGATGMGVIQAKAKLPLRWDAKTGENVLWKAPLPLGDGAPDHNQGSPIVSNGRVFVTSCVWAADANRKATQPEHHLTCYRLADGKQLWDRVVKPGPWTISDLRGGYAAPTPASDGKHVYAAFGSSILHALTLDGKPTWSQVIPDQGGWFRGTGPPNSLLKNLAPLQGNQPGGQ